MGRLMDWLFGDRTAPTIEQTLAEGFSGPKLDHPVYLHEDDTMNLKFPDGGVVSGVGVWRIE